MVMDYIRETVGLNAWQSLNLSFEYDLSKVHVLVRPVASEGIHVICPQAVAHLCVQSAL
jgi:hypothetical protein